MSEGFDGSGIWAVLGAVVIVASWTEGDYMARVITSAVVIGGISMLKLRPTGMSHAVAVVLGATLLCAATMALAARDALVRGEQFEVVVEASTRAAVTIASVIAVLRVISPRWTRSMWQNDGQGVSDGR
jgi:hypothetical protein